MPDPAPAPAPAPAPIKRKTRTIRVKANRPDDTFAWYGLTPQTHRTIKHGDIFEIWEEDFSPKWMERYNGPLPEAPKARPAGPGQVTDLSRRIEELEAENARLRAAKEQEPAKPSTSTEPPAPPAPQSEPPAKPKK